jgi:hypothetical protein
MKSLLSANTVDTMFADPDSEPYPRRQNGRDTKKTGRIFLVFPLVCWRHLKELGSPPARHKFLFLKTLITG